MTESAQTTPRPRHGVLALYAMVATGGVAALSWETIWQLRASLAFGVSATGTALTLAATMGGMTVGALLAGAWLRRAREHTRPLRLYGGLELAIGIAGLLVLPGFRLLEAFDARLYAVLPGFAPLLHGLGMALLIAPASLAMGATVPVFQLVARAHATSISALYATNTAGAALGVLSLSFVVLPALGVARACVLLAALNVAVFVASRLLEPRAEATPQAATAARPPALPLPLAFLAVGCTGFVTFALEVTWFRALRGAFWSTSGTFAILLAAVLVPLALGARLVPWLRRRERLSPGTLLAAAGAAVLLATPFIERMDLAIGVPGGYGVTMAVWFTLSLLVVGPPVACLATALPWCLEDYPEPRTTGRLYGLNALGSVLGSLGAAWGLLPALGSSRSAWVLGVLMLTVAFCLVAPRRRAAVVAIGLASLAFAASLTSSPGRERVQFHRDHHGNTILAHEEGPDFTASVLESATGLRLLIIDGFVATTDHWQRGHYMERLGRLPALLHPAPERGLVICFGTGQTANGLRREELAAVDVIEVSRSVIELAPLFPRNEGVIEDPRVETIVMDGRAWLRRTDRRYDVITLEPMPPNFSGVNALYSREFYAIMREHLTPDGVVAQWLPVHMLTHHHASSIALTFVEAFPDAVLWFDPVGGMPILLGRSAGAAEPLAQRWPGLGRAERDLGASEIRQSVWLRREALERYARDGEPVTDDNQLLQWGQMRPRSSKAFYAALREANMRTLQETAGRGPFVLQDPTRVREPDRQ